MEAVPGRSQNTELQRTCKRKAYFDEDGNSEGSIPFTRSNPLLEPIRWLSATNPIADSHKQSHIVKDSSYSFVIVFSFLVHRVHRGTGENVEPVGYFFGWKLSRLN